MNVQIQMLIYVKEIWNASTLRGPSSANVIMDFFLILTKYAKVGSSDIIKIIELGANYLPVCCPCDKHAGNLS